MKKCFRILVLLATIVSLLVTSSFAAFPISEISQAMYAAGVTYGDPVAVTIDPYTEFHYLRLDPANVLGGFDAVQSAGGIANANFFSLAARTWTNYTFGETFYNVDWESDIQFAEVTWGSGTSWHVEAAKVILTDAVVDGVLLDEYYAGVVWNRIGVNYVSPETRMNYAQSLSPDYHELAESVTETDGVKEWIGFNLPENITCAGGITLIDVTKDVYSLAFPATYLNVGGTGATYTVLSLNPIVYDRIPGPNGNTDGYDLDAIRVWKTSPVIEGDSATGMGTRILAKGTWFMYNNYPGSTAGVYEIQAGNPADGINIIGTYSIIENSDGTYTAVYDIDDTIVIDGWIYNIEVTSSHLAVSDTMSFSAVPGLDDNQDFGVPFTADGNFCVYAHFAVEYK